MQATTTRAFRRKYINHYLFYDFDTFEDYFFYLHLNRHTQLMHFWGALLSAPLLPWGVAMLLYHWNPWPFIFYTVMFYGSGFSSHVLFDGRVSETTPDYGPSYFYVIVINFKLLAGNLKEYEARYVQRYPHTLWVYSAEHEPPEYVKIAEGLK